MIDKGFVYFLDSFTYTVYIALEVNDYTFDHILHPP